MNTFKAYSLGLFAGHADKCARENSDFSQTFDKDMLFRSFDGMDTIELKLAYFRGYFDATGKVGVSSINVPICSMHCSVERLLGNFMEIVSDIPCLNESPQVGWTGTNAIDFLGKLYAGRENSKENSENFEKYQQWLYPSGNDRLPRCQVYKKDELAIIPAKSKESDVGYDLTVIKVAKKLSDKVTLYDTGLTISVQHGFYAEVVPRSSLSKSGYMLANSVGIIDRSYLGNLLVALVKVDENAPDIELPFRCCQLIFRPQIHMDMEQVHQPFEETARGEGGFGSTNKK